MHHVQWKIWLNVKDNKKASRYLASLQEKMNREVSGVKIEQYWKIPELQVLHFRSSHDTVTKEECIYDLLIVAQAVSDSWLVRGPFEHANGVVEFLGWVNGAGYPLKNAEFTFRVEAST
jgi:hypothetical protein